MPWLVSVWFRLSHQIDCSIKCCLKSEFSWNSVLWINLRQPRATSIWLWTMACRRHHHIRHHILLAESCSICKIKIKLTSFLIQELQLDVYAHLTTLWKIHNMFKAVLRSLELVFATVGPYFGRIEATRAEMQFSIWAIVGKPGMIDNIYRYLQVSAARSHHPGYDLALSFIIPVNSTDSDHVVQYVLTNDS